MARRLQAAKHSYFNMRSMILALWTMHDYKHIKGDEYEETSLKIIISCFPVSTSCPEDFLKNKMIEQRGCIPWSSSTPWTSVN